MKKAVIIIPTFNEKNNIEKLIISLEEKVFPKIHNYAMSILVADDNSPDGTVDTVENLAKKWKNIHISSGEKKGLGAAYIRGMDYAIEKLNADILFELDADGQHDETKIPEFLKKIDEGYDMVIGTRYSQGGSIPENWPLHRKLFSICANIFVRTVFLNFSIHDWTGGYRALKKEVFLKEKHELKEYTGYIFQISFLQKAIRDHFKVAEVPFHFSDRTLGKSKIAPLGYILTVVKFVLLTRIYEYKRFVKFLIVGGTGFIIQLSIQELMARVFLRTLPESIRDGTSATFGAEGAIISNFLFNNFWTFKDTHTIKENAGFWTKLLKFNTTSLASIAVQGLSVFIFVHLLGDELYFGPFSIKTRIVVLIPTIVLIVIPLNYLIYNKIIWKTQYLKKDK